MSFQNIQNYSLIPYSQASQSILLHGTVKKATGVNKEPLPVHSKSNITLISAFIFYVYYK